MRSGVSRWLAALRAYAVTFTLLCACGLLQWHSCNEPRFVLLDALQTLSTLDLALTIGTLEDLEDVVRVQQTTPAHNFLPNAQPLQHRAWINCRTVSNPFPLLAISSRSRHPQTWRRGKFAQVRCQRDWLRGPPVSATRIARTS